MSPKRWDFELTGDDQQILSGTSFPDDRAGKGVRC